MRTTRFVAVALIAFVASGCAKVSTPAAPAAKNPAAVARVDADRAMCFAAAEGKTVVDDALRRAIDLARRDSRATSVTDVGRQWVRKARLSADPGYYLNVEGCVELALRAEPGHVAALELRGLALMNQHKFEDARVLSERILAENPENATALGTLSDALLELGRYDEATRAAQRAMSAHPGMAAAARGSYLRWIVGDTARAKILIRDALAGRDAADPEPTAYVLTEAGHLYWRAGDHAGADALYREALKWVAEYPPALVGRGRAALAERRFETAIESFKIAQRARPAVETSWLLGDAYALRGDSVQADAAYAEAVRLGRRGDKLTLAQFLLEKNRDAAEALALIEEERATRGGVYIDDTYALALFRNGRLDEARAVAARVVKTGTPDAKLYYHAGLIHRACGERAAGNALLAQALKLDAAFDADGARTARAMIGDAPAAVAGR